MNLKRITVITVILAIILSSVYFFWLSPQYTVPILMYHRFGTKESSLFVDPGNFRKQMAYLKHKEYDIITLDELVEGIKSKKKFEHNTVVITIDDGHQDNFVYAYPILKEYEFPAIIFLISNFIDNNADFMTWEDICIMSGNNISFGGHTRNNTYLPSIKKTETLWNEIEGCKSLIESKVGRPVDYFCYPTGGFSDRVKAVVKEAGYKGACTTNRGFTTFDFIP